MMQKLKKLLKNRKELRSAEETLLLMNLSKEPTEEAIFVAEITTAEAVAVVVVETGETIDS